VTKPAWYYYFKNKRGVFYAILDSAIRVKKGVLAEVIGSEGTALDRLICLYRRFYQGIVEHPALAKLIINLISGAPQGAPQYDVDQYHDLMMGGA